MFFMIWYAWLECSYLKMFPMSGELLIQHVVKKESREEIIISIIQLLVIPFFFLTCLVYVLAILKLLGWLH